MWVVCSLIWPPDRSWLPPPWPVAAWSRANTPTGIVPGYRPGPPGPRRSCRGSASDSRPRNEAGGIDISGDCLGDGEIERERLLDEERQPAGRARPARERPVGEGRHADIEGVERRLGQHGLEVAVKAARAEALGRTLDRAFLGGIGEGRESRRPRRCSSTPRWRWAMPPAPMKPMRVRGGLCALMRVITCLVGGRRRPAQPPVEARRLGRHARAP